MKHWYLARFPQVKKIMNTLLVTKMMIIKLSQPLCVMLPITGGYVKSYDDETKCVSAIVLLV